MKNEFVLAFNEVLEEKQLPKEIILEALEAAMVSAYRRAVNASNAQHIEAKIDLETGDVTIYAEKEIVDAVQDDRTEVSLDDAKKVDADASIGGMAIVESTPNNFGRVAAQTARQVIQQRIREAERDAQLNHYSKQLGEIVSGVIQAINSQAVTLGLDMKAEGIMPRNHQIPGEKYRVHERIRALLLEVKPTSRGPQIVLSRAHRNFLRRLLENEVPEIYHGLVEIRSIAREPGQRSKVAVSALQTGVDPVGACVGLRGVRIQAIVKELNDEKIDVIEWNPDPVVYIAKSLSPARVTGVYLNEHAKSAKTATVVVPEDQLSLAIGRDGQNARLAARLTSWRIDIKSLPEAATDAVYKLQNDPDYAVFVEQEAEVVPQVEIVLAKKAEGRPVTPEEYQLLGQFVDRIEKGIIDQLEKDNLAEQERIKVAEAGIPKEAYEMPIEELGIPLRYSTILSGNGLITVGDLMLQFNLDTNVILGLNGIGAKAFQVIEESLANVTFPEPEKIEVAEEQVIGEEEAAEERLVEATPQTEEFEIAQPTEEAKELVVIEEVVPSDALPSQPREEELPAEGPTPEEVEGEIAEPSLVMEVEASPEGQTVPELIEQGEESIEDIFKWRPEEMEFVKDVYVEEEEEQEANKKKKKKKKFVEYEFDPDKEINLVKKKRKRDSGDWGDDWSI
jgi:N utilization substance protein A